MNSPDARTRIALGGSGLAVAPLGWGMWRLAGASTAEARARIDAALEIGCTLFDTADVYGGSRGFGAAEQLFGEVLREAPALRAGLVIASKAGVRPGVPYDSSVDYLISACEASLTRLGLECLDLFQIHRPDLLAHPAELAEALTRLRASGKIRAAGVSNFAPSQLAALRRWLPSGLATVQPELSALAPAALTDGTLDAAMTDSLGVLAWSPLAQGRLGDGARGANEAERRVLAVLDRLAGERGLARSAIAYAWVLAHPCSPIALIGSQRPERIRAAADAYRVRLTRAEWYQILEAARGAPMP